MTIKKPTKKPAPRAKPRRTKPPARSGAPVRDDFSAIVDMIADAKERGAFDPKNRPRTVSKPTVTNTPDTPFARIVAGAKTEDQQLRALEAAAQREVALPADAFVVGEPVTAAAIIAGNVLSSRADVEALGLRPLALHEQGEWDPETEYWGEEGEPIEEWAKPIIARGKRPMFEMEQVLPGTDPEDFDSDPIIEASELNAAGDRVGARELLMKLLAQDLRCLDAHAHLGNFAFDRSPEEAQRHYEIGMSIGAFSLGRKFDGVLAWGLGDNRPFLRCMLGVGLCAWRSGHTREAAAVFRKMLWLNPSDNQGARFNLAAVEAGKTWEEMEGDE